MNSTQDPFALMLLCIAFAASIAITHLRMNRVADRLLELERHLLNQHGDIDALRYELAQTIEALHESAQDPADIPVARAQDRPVKNRTRKQKVVPARSRLHTVTLVGDE